MKTIIMAAVTVAILIPTTTRAQSVEGCTTVDYQGAPLEMCPPQEPDPTNCYTGDYQGAPIEICMPTGWQPDPSWTYQGEPIVMHVSKDYVAPVVAEAAAPPAPPPVVVAEPELDVVSIAAAAVAGVPRL